MSHLTEESPDSAPRGIETNALNTISESERHGRPSDLFWPWFGANVSVFGLSWGSWVLGFGISFWQGLIVGAIGIVVSFLLCGFIAVAGKRGSAPTMVLSRAAFGVNGNRLSSLLSWILTVGWETVLVALAALATSTVFGQLGWSDGDITKIVSLIVVVALVIFAGVYGFDVVMRLQVVITWVTGVLTIVYVVLVLDHIHWHSVSGLSSGSTQAVIGALIMAAAGFGLGWVNAAADYSRYLPRSSSSGGIVGWTTFGGSVAPVVLLLFGLLLAGSDSDLNGAISGDPIGALASILPEWFLVPFVIVAILGLVGGAALDIYSSGLALLSMGLRAPRYVAALIDGLIMTIGAVYIVFGPDSFFGPFQGFLITVGVPIAAWAGVFLADLLLRKEPYHEPSLYDPKGVYGSVNWVNVGLIVVGTVLGWGLVTNSNASWLNWQGYLLKPFGLGGKDFDWADPAAWAHSNLGVVVALVVGFVGTLLLTRGMVRRQEKLG